MSRPNIAMQTYITAVCGDDHQYAIDAINERFGTRYRKSRIREWENGARLCPRHIQDWIRGQVLYKMAALDQHPDLSEIAHMLDLEPEMENG